MKQAVQPFRRFRFGVFEADLRTGELTKLGKRVSASPKKRSCLDSTTDEFPPIAIIGAGTGESDSLPTTGNDEDDLDLSSISSPRSKSSTTILYALHPRSLATTPMSISEAELTELYSIG